MALPPLYCFIFKETLPFYSEETLNALSWPQFRNGHAERVACLAERSPAVQVIRICSLVKSTAFADRTGEFCSGRPPAVREAAAAAATFAVKLPPTHRSRAWRGGFCR